MISQNISGALVLFLLTCNASYACSCIDETLHEQLQRANNVFIGLVRNNTKMPLALFQGKSLISEIATVRVIKGQNLGIIKSKTPFVKSSCDIPFLEGVNYLIFDTGERPYRIQDCSGTVEMSELPQDRKTGRYSSMSNPNKLPNKSDERFANRRLAKR